MGDRSSETRFFVGVDGGGSRCRVRVCDANGRRVGTAEGGSANVYLNFDAALKTIGETVAVALGPSRAGSEGRCEIGLGLAGVSSPAVALQVAERLSHFGRACVSNDAVTACLGAHAGADGGLVIAGTGSAAVLRLAGSDVNIGGRGFILGDDGSGALIGRDIWRRALRAVDGLEPFTPLLRDLMAVFSDDPVAVITWARSATSGDFAAYAPKVIEAAEGGDPAAVAIMQGAGRSIGELVSTLQRRGAPRISLVGGLSGSLRSFLSPEIVAALSPPLFDALDGALLLAGAPLDVSATG